MDLWPEVVTKVLWLCASRAVYRSCNIFNLDSKGYSPEMKLAQLATKPHVQNKHAMLCPVFTLNKKLQGAPGIIPKWNLHVDAGVYLGISPVYSSKVALVLNLATGHVSPQYHVAFDDHFTTVDYIYDWQKYYVIHLCLGKF